MSDFSRGWRPSANVSFQSQDPLRREWLDQAAIAPDEWRASQGLTPLSPENRDAIRSYAINELPLLPGDQDWFGRARLLPPRPLGIDPAQQANSQLKYAFPHTPSFRQQSSLALLGEEIGRMLEGQQAQAGGFSGALDQFGGLASGMTPLERLRPPLR